MTNENNKPIAYKCKRMHNNNKRIWRITMTKQIGCKGEDARFIACSGCLHHYDTQKCYKTREEGNLKIVFR